MRSTTQAACAPSAESSCSVFCLHLNRHAFYRPDNLIQMWVVMSVSGVKTIDDNLVVILPFGMYVLFIVQGHGNMGYFLAAEEDQVSLPHCSAIDTTGQKIMLLMTAISCKGVLQCSPTLQNPLLTGSSN